MSAWTKFFLNYKHFMCVKFKFFTLQPTISPMFKRPPCHSPRKPTPSVAPSPSWSSSIDAATDIVSHCNSKYICCMVASKLITSDSFWNPPQCVYVTRTSWLNESQYSFRWNWGISTTPLTKVQAVKFMPDQRTGRPDRNWCMIR